MRSILWIFFLPFCFINLGINVFVVTSHCLSHQKSALLHLRRNFIFNPFESKKLVHWNQSHDCCQWNGVTCDKGHVIALDLSGESISGGLDDSSNGIFNLQFLQNLNLAHNKFHSVVPSKLHKLTNLRYLNLSNAGFEGQIPVEISYLAKLVFLDLSTSLHTLKLEEPDVTILLQKFTELKELYLDGVKMFAQGKEWGQTLSTLQNLQIVSMSSCNLFGPIDYSIAKLRSLLVLRLDNNNIASSVPKTFVGLTNLTILQLRNCNLSGVFPEQVFQMPNLQVIDVSDNQDLQGSLPKFQHHGFLHSMNLSHTKFSGQLPSSIHNLRKLSALDLSNSKFSGTLPCSISKVTSLVYLDLSFNNFTGSLPSFNLSKSLTYLSLYHNDLKGEVPSFHFTGLEDLITIDLGDNLFNGRVPSSLFTLRSLRELILSNNRFEGLLDEFPNASSSPLEILDISGNNLQGPVPVSIFQLKRLTLLQLSANKFNGTIDLGMMRSMENLATLDLAHNNLLVDTTLVNNHNLSSLPKLNNFMLGSCKLKEFPSFLRNQSNLLYLDLSSNQIRGTIPNWIWRFDFMVFLNLSNNFLTDLEGPFHNITSNLFLLDLHSNQLKGHPPIFPKNVIYLDYSSNGFSSIAPLDIGNHLPFTYFLSFSNNSFHGKIHESLCNMSTLRVLDLSDNNFSETIPACLTRMSNTLRVLNLAGNNLKGQVSNTFSAFCALRFLDLNENFLSGTIPESLANCQKLQVLNLGKNQLTDRFPCFLGNVSTLRVMILRSNKIYGTLECPNSIGKWETLQIVDLASNNLNGTLPIALLQSWKVLMRPAEDESGKKFGQLSFDIYDNANVVDFKNALSTVNKDLAPKLAELIAVEPPFVISHLFSDINANDFGRQSYLDSVTIVNKGRQLKLVKILTAFTSLDFSSNHFEGPIPEELINFKALHALNLSQNAFSGHIPSSIGNLKYLESLDLSVNSFRGDIPTELASLYFLEFLNLSHNHLTGKIPTGTQIQSFEADCFKGNEALCGPPLTQSCSLGEIPGLQTPSSKTTESNDGNSIDWNFLSAELGFTFGLGIIILPLIFCQQWRLQYFKYADYILWKIIPQLDFVYEHREGKTYRSLRWKPY
ncbi:receptor-like protein 7 [Neltuma alba]|uniref:receptor-like protein 7 n=1 Tax=Neltuma alba TaxID=207710 RepID=UPI0010A3D18E|nr:receptor-like protein 7 [Prosopis alba]